MSIAMLHGVNGGGGSAPTLITKSITVNGTYTASSDNADGYSEVSVTVPPTLFRERVDGSLQEVTANDLDGLTTIGQSAFNGLLYIRSVTLPSSIRTLGSNAFAYTGEGNPVSSPVPIILLNEGLTTIGSNCFNYCRAHNLIIPDSVTTIGNTAFNSMTRLKKIVYGEGALTLPSSGCNFNTALKAIILKQKSVPTLQGAGSFDYGNANKVFYAPTDLIESYKTATNWSSIFTTFELSPYVQTISERDLIDTTLYTKCCVYADGDYDLYEYSNGQWNKIDINA